jgi:hypothetical protein
LKNVVVSCLFAAEDPSGVHKTTPASWEHPGVAPWVDSMIRTGLESYILTDIMHPELDRISRVAEGGPKVLHVGTCQSHPMASGKVSPHDYRWVEYLRFMYSFRDVRKVFFTDLYDVIAAGNPFPDIQERTIYCGDEPVRTKDCNWLQKRIPAHRNEGVKLLTREKRLLLNAGLVGGYRYEMIHFLTEMVHAINEAGWDRPYNSTDMVLFNHVLRVLQEHEPYDIVHGEPVNSLFRGNERHRTDVWFIHK